MPPPFVVPEGMTPAEYVMQRAMEAHMEAVARGAERDDWALNRFAQVWEARHGTAPFEAIVTLGQMLETRLGMRPDWTAKAEVSSWLSGLEKALRAAEGDPDLVVETALDMRDAGLAIPSPFSLVNLVRDAAARKRVPTPRGPAIHWLN
jgi:hypothetical protein